MVMAMAMAMEISAQGDRDLPMSLRGSWWRISQAAAVELRVLTARVANYEKQIAAIHQRIGKLDSGNRPIRVAPEQGQEIAGKDQQSHLAQSVKLDVPTNGQSLALSSGEDKDFSALKDLLVPLIDQRLGLATNQSAIEVSAEINEPASGATTFAKSSPTSLSLPSVARPIYSHLPEASVLPEAIVEASSSKIPCE